MLDPSFLDHCSQDIVDMFSEIENEIMLDIVRRILKTGKVTKTAEYEYRKAKSMTLLRGEVSPIINRVLKASKKEVTSLFKNTAVKAIRTDDIIYALKGIEPVDVLETDNMLSIILQGADDAMKLLGNFTKTTAQVADKSLYNSLDKAYLLVQTDIYDYNRAIRQAVNDLAKHGIYRVAYPSGHIDTTETSVRRAVLTALNQTCAKLQLYRAEDVGCDLVEVTSHIGARPSHAEFQGKVFCLKGKRDGYKNFEESTGYGTGEGLCGWNCRHSFFPFFEGLSVSAYKSIRDKVNKKENEAYYYASQKQRYYERNVRAAKAECTALNEAVLYAENEEQKNMFYDDFICASVKLKRREEKLKAFLGSHPELKRQREREWKSGFDRSVSAKAVWANRKSK